MAQHHHQTKMLQANPGEAAARPAQRGAARHPRPLRGLLAAPQHSQPRGGSQHAAQKLAVQLYCTTVHHLD